MNSIIQEILDQGMDVQIGKHSGVTGYYAVVVDPRANICPECESPYPNSWSESGHGLTPLAALKNAIRVFDGENPPLDRAAFEGTP